MNDQRPVESETMKIGLLLEAAQSHQDIVDDTLKRLQSHTLGLDSVVRDEVRRALIAELSGLVEHVTAASNALRDLHRSAQLRAVGTSALLTALPGLLAASLLWWWMPSPKRLMALRAQQQQLSASLTSLAQQGGRIDLRHCGDAGRLCVRIDRHAPSFGAQSDYYVVQGY